MNELIVFQLKDYVIRFKPMIADLINKYKRKYGFGLSEEDLEDLLQDCVLVAYEKSLKPDFILESKLSTFLYAIAKNKLFEKLRVMGRITTREYKDEIEVLEQENYDYSKDELTTLKLKLIKECMKLLSATQLQVFKLYFFHNFSMNRIAIELESNENSMKAQNYKAKTNIKNCVQAKLV